VNLDSPARAKTRTPLKAQLRDAVRVAILDAAEELLALPGLAGATPAKHAGPARVGVGTLYNHFDDREALVRALFETRRSQLRPRVAAAVTAGQGQPFEVRLRGYVRDVFAALEAHRRFVKLMIENEHLRQRSGATVADALAEGFTAVVAVGVRERVVPAARAELLVTVALGGLKAVVMRRILDGRPLAPEAGPLVDVLLDGARVRR